MQNCMRYIFTILLLGSAFIGTLYAQQVEVIFEDDFSDNRHEWSESEGEENSLRIEQGKYWFSHKTEEGAWLTWQEIGIDPQKDFVLHTTITKESGVDNYGYGFLWGLKDVNHYYQFALSGNGYYRYVKNDGNDWNDIIAWTQSDAIHQGDGATNMIMIKKDGERVKFFVNDQLVDEAVFEPFFGENLGYIVYNILEVSIDELRVEQPAPEKPPATIVEPSPTPTLSDTPKSSEIILETVSGSRVALTIGNSAYGKISLATAEHDAHAVAQELEALGFYVIRANNLTLPEMETTIDAFLGLLSGKELAVVYFSGYAAQRRGENYLLPVGRDIRSEDHLLYEAVSINDLLWKISQAGNQQTIMILDACREIPNLWLFEKGLSAMSVPPGVAVVYDSAPGTVSASIDGSLSVFTRQIQQVLQQGDIAIPQMLERVKEGVATETEGWQIPWFSYSFKE